MTKAHYGAVYLLGQGSQSNCTKYDTLVSCFLARYSHAGGAGRSLGCGLVAIRAVVLLPPEHVSLWRAWFPFLSATTAVLVVCAQLDDVHYQGLILDAVITQARSQYAAAYRLSLAWERQLQKLRHPRPAVLADCRDRRPYVCVLA